MAVPEEVLEAMSGLEERMQRLEDQMRKILESWSAPAIALLSPPERASAYMAVAKALNAVYCLFLRTRGESPDDHPVKSELDRAAIFDDKVQYACGKFKSPRPTMSLDVRAANRFIEHAIPDLSQEQKQLVREAGNKSKKKKTNLEEALTKNKRQKSSVSVAEAAAAFLAEAADQMQT